MPGFVVRLGAAERSGFVAPTSKFGRDEVVGLRPIEPPLLRSLRWLEADDLRRPGRCGRIGCPRVCSRPGDGTSTHPTVPPTTRPPYGNRLWSHRSRRCSPRTRRLLENLAEGPLRRFDSRHAAESTPGAPHRSRRRSPRTRRVPANSKEPEGSPRTRRVPPNSKAPEGGPRTCSAGLTQSSRSGSSSIVTPLAVAIVTLARNLDWRYMSQTQASVSS